MRLTDWGKFIQHNITIYASYPCHSRHFYALFGTNLIAIDSLHVGRPLLRQCLVANVETNLARQHNLSK